MKILFVTPYFVPAWSYGGPVKVIYDVARQLQQRGHQVTVITTDVLDKKNRHPVPHQVIEGIEVWYFRNLSNLLSYRYNGYFPLGIGRWLAKNISQFDLVHCHDFYTYLNLIVHHYATRFHIPYVVQPHGTIKYTRIKARFRLLKYMYLHLNAFVLQDAAAIIALNPEEVEDIINFPPFIREKIFIIPNGIDPEEFSRVQEDPGVRKKYGLSQHLKTIVYFGRIQHIKGIDITLRALSLVTDIKFQFIILGRDEDEKQKLLNLAKELGIENQVHFFGLVLGEEKIALLKACDLFVFNSRSEGMPMTVLEATACGLPSILSSACHVPELERFEAGIVLKENSPIETAKQIKRYFAQPSQIERMRRKCLNVARSIFSLHRSIESLLKVYDAIPRSATKIT